MSGKPKYVSEGTKAQMVELRNQGKTSREISEIVGIPRERVRQILLSQGLPNKVPITLDLVDYSHVDPIWFAEFRGFFMGEGCATVAFYPNATSRAHYQVQLAVALRDDDRDVVFDIKNKLGGNSYIHPIYKRSSPLATWQLVGWSRCTNLISFLVQGTLPAKKRRDLLLLDELCQKRLQWPYNLEGDHLAELHRYYLALKDIKRYQGSEG